MRIPRLPVHRTNLTSGKCIDDRSATMSRVIAMNEASFLYKCVEVKSHGSDAKSETDASTRNQWVFGSINSDTVGGTVSVVR